MAKIYLTVKDNRGEQQFTGTDGKAYARLYTIERKITGNMQLSGAMINGEPRYIDFTVPTEVNRLPRDAKPVGDELAERLWKADTHYFGE